MTSYDIQYGDTLGAIAERMGHPGEWRALAQANIGLVSDDTLSDEAKMYVVAERMYVGQTLDVPLEWETIEIEPPASTSATPDSSMTATQLAQLAQNAQTLAELDAIDAVAAGRVTVTNAVDARRTVLLDQGATA